MIHPCEDTRVAPYVTVFAVSIGITVLLTLAGAAWFIWSRFQELAR